MKKLNNEELETFFSQIALFLRSGISAFEGVSIMMEDQEQRDGKEILRKINDEMEQGGDFSGAVEKTEVFPGYACRMLRLGEVSGRLDEVTVSLADYYAGEEALSQSVKRAVSYPLFMMIMLFGVLFVLMTKVMPVFESVYLSLGTSMDGPAGAVLKAGKVMNRYSGIFLVLLIVILAFILWAVRTESGAAAVSALMKKRRAGGAVRENVARYRLASGLGMCLRSGLDPERSLGLLEELVEDASVSEKIKLCSKKVEEGTPFDDACMETALFGRMHSRMIRVGQRTGSLDQVLERIAQQCRKAADDAVWRRVSMIEPAVVIVLAVIVGVILLSVMLPLMSIMAEIA